MGAHVLGNPNKWLKRTPPWCHAACKDRGAGVVPPFGYAA